MVLHHRRQRHFNPRTREGCDNVPVVVPVPDIDFNPRTREGCDVTGDSWDDDLIDMSIHAPVKGATEGVLTIKKEYLQFQSTHP